MQKQLALANLISDSRHDVIFKITNQKEMLISKIKEF